MIIKNVQIANFHGDERTGFDRDGNPYRGRAAEIFWPDEDGKRQHRVFARLRTQPCDEIDSRGMGVDSVFDADISFGLSQGRNGYYFTNCYINKIL